MVNVSKSCIYGIKCPSNLPYQPSVNPTPVIVKESFNASQMLKCISVASLPEMQTAWTSKITSDLLKTIGSNAKARKKLEQDSLANLVKLFDLAAHNNEYQAFEIAKLLPTIDSKKTCMKYAQTKSYIGLYNQLADHINELETILEKENEKSANNL